MLPEIIMQSQVTNDLVTSKQLKASIISGEVKEDKENSPQTPLFSWDHYI